MVQIIKEDILEKTVGKVIVMKKVTVIILIFSLVFLLFSCGFGDKSAAKSVAKEYCKLVQANNSGIESVSFSGSDRKSGTTYYFEVTFKYTGGVTKTGEVKCYKDSEGDYVCDGVTFN